MRTGELYIDGIDIYTTYGIFITKGGYNSLLTFPTLVDPDKNDWPDEHGLEVDLSNPVLKSREITITFWANNKLKLNEFVTFLGQAGYRHFSIAELGKEWDLRLSKQNKNDILCEISEFSLVFVEDKVTRKTDVSSPGGGVPILSSSYQIDGTSLEGYGIVISSGENDILKMPSIKQNLTCSFSTSDGQVYDTGKVYFSEKEVTLSGTFFASDISRFWSCYEAFFFNLIRPGERRIYVDQTGEEYPCYYKKSSNFKIISLRGRVVVDFSFTLVLTSCKANNTEYFLATEDGAFITTEDDYFIDLSRVQTPEPAAYALEMPQTLAETAPEEVEIRKRKITEMPLAGSLDNLIVPAVDKTTNRNVHIPSELLKKEEGGTSNVFQLSDLKDVDKNVDNAADGMVLQKQGEKWVAAVVEGGGSSGGGITMKLKSLTGTLLTGITGGEIRIGYNFTSVYNDDGTETGGGTATYKVNSQKVSALSIRQGDNYFDVSSYLVVGTNTVEVSVKDSTGATRTLSYTVELVSLSISSSYSPVQVNTGEITYRYIPVGAIAKTIHFILDGTQIGEEETSISNRQLSFVIPAQTHGAHRLVVYMTATINGAEVRSNELTHDLICVEEGNNAVIVASPFNLTEARQYDRLSIPFVVYNPAASTSLVTLSANGVVLSEQTVDRTLQSWVYRISQSGALVLQIACAGVSKTFNLTIMPAEVIVEPETADLELYLSSQGRSNNDNNRDSWISDNIASTMTGFNWKTNGWLADDQGSICLRVNNGAQVVIPLLLFEKDVRSSGKTIEIEFLVREVYNYDTPVISCFSGKRGIQITGQNARIKSEQSDIETKFKDMERVRLAFVVEKRTDNRLLSIYVNGIKSQTFQYPEIDNFMQSMPVGITISGEDATVDIYTVRSYNNNLNRYQLLNNYIADIDDYDRKAEVYRKNDIYDAYGNISFLKVRERIDTLVIEGDLPQYKGDKKTNKIYHYSSTNDRLHWWANIKNNVQGTSSQYYPRKNYKFEFIDGLTYIESGEHADSYQVTEEVLPASIFCIKTDFAESSGTHNTGVANMADRMLKEMDILTQAQKENNKVRTTVAGKPCALFHKATAESEPVFVGKVNLNTDKAAENTFGFKPGDESWEFLNNTSDLALFKTSDFTNWQDSLEARYPDGGTDIADVQKVFEWVVSCKGNVDKFKAEFEQYFNKEQVVFYALVTLAFGMTDQRAKNMFITRIGNKIWLFILYDNDTLLPINNEGLIALSYNVEIRDKVNNANAWNGADSELWKLVEEAFAEEIREMYYTMRQRNILSYDRMIDYLYNRQAGKWSEAIYNEDGYYKYEQPLIEGYLDYSQSHENPQTIKTGAYLYALQGSREMYGKWIWKNRFLYLDSKFLAGSILGDTAVFRTYTPAEWAGIEPCADITLTSFNAMYFNIKWGSVTKSARVGFNETIKMVAPSGMQFNDTETIIYGASLIASLGDLSPLYPGTVDVSKMVKLKELIVGSGVEGYQNRNLHTLSIGENRMLKKLDVRNCTEYSEPIDVRNCTNIEEIYAQGTSITAVNLPQGGNLSKLYLPGTITNLSLKNQPKLLDGSFEIAGVDNLSTLIYENSGIDILSLIERCLTLPAIRLSRVRLIGIDGMANNLNTLYKLKDLGGIDENGNNTQKAIVTGKYYVAVAREDQLAELQENFPELTITYGRLLPPTITTFIFKSSRNKVIANSSLECNLPYKKVDETTYTVIADDDTTISYTFHCDNHEDCSGDYIVSGTRTVTVTAVYIPLLTLRVQIYNTSIYPAGATVTIDGKTYTSDNNGYVYIRTRKAVTGTVSAPGYQIQPFAVPAQVIDYSDTIYVYQAVNVRFTVKDEFGNLVVGSTITCNGQTKTTNRYGECDLSLSKGTYEYRVENRKYEFTAGSITVDTSDITEIVRTYVNWENWKPEENGNIQMLLRNSTGLTKGTSLKISSTDNAYVIDWGDGTTTEATGEGEKIYEHLYTTTDLYNVEVRGCENVTYCNFSYDSRGNIGTSIFSSMCAYWSIGNSQVKGLSFYFSTNDSMALRIIGDIFKNDRERTSFQDCFRRCDKLVYIPVSLFENCVNATNFGGCFAQCSSLTSIPAGLFDTCPNVTDFGICFGYCTSLTSIPAGLFVNCHKVGKFSSCFEKCTSLTSIPADLFGDCPEARFMQSCFKGCTSLTSIPAGLFDGCSVMYFGACFSGCTSLTSIPKGLFDRCRNVNSFDRYFYGCTSLTSIPAGLFDNCSEVENFNYCFYGCASLTSIPVGLFDNCSEVENFDYCFDGCTNLTSIPVGLFDNCLKVNNFRNCFLACNKVEGNLPPLWILYYGKNVTSLNCFLGCSKATNWQEVPQSWGGPGPEYEPPSSVVLSQRSGVVMADYRALDVRLKNIEQQLNIN
ncbi:leucine-rich repeat protein [Parabacteroides pacaensis]|uniref:leucine-rich repeat protein n=1 Tax=Parabacteroides pacaensis TaxID=2086575 RepID=UPI000D103EF1|nr:leucine-rich repeat domain-containing protein [Parabacteroides pacaensis]